MSYSIQQKTQISDDLNKYLEEAKADAEREGGTFSQNKLADKIGVSSSQLGYVLKKDFEATNNAKSLMVSDRLLTKIERFLGTGQVIWPLTNFDLCINTFMETKMNGGQRIIDGEKGSGKTFSAKYFCKTYPANSFLITCASDLNAKQFIVRMARQVGLDKKFIEGKSRHNIRVNICDHMLDMENALMIVDETEVSVEDHKHEIIGMLKDVYDHRALHDHVGIVVMGANDFTARVVERTQMRKKFAYPQFLSRFGTRVVNLEGYDPKQAREVCKLYDLSQEQRNSIVNEATDYRVLSDLISIELNESQLLKEVS